MVYVIQQQVDKNVLPARPFGEIKVILEDRVQLTFIMDRAIKTFERALKTFNDKDYLLLIGDPLAIGIATHIAAKNNEGRVKVLKWDRQERVYIPIDITFNQLEEIDV